MNAQLTSNQLQTVWSNSCEKAAWTVSLRHNEDDVWLKWSKYFLTVFLWTGVQKCPRRQMHHFCHLAAHCVYLPVLASSKPLAIPCRWEDAGEGLVEDCPSLHPLPSTAFVLHLLRILCNSSRTGVEPQSLVLVHIFNRLARPRSFQNLCNPHVLCATTLSGVIVWDFPSFVWR